MRPLLVNIGNTCTTLAVAGRGGSVTVLDRRVGGYAGNGKRTPALVSRLAERHGIDDAALCSVVPAQTQFWSGILKDAFGISPLRVSAAMDLGLRVSYPEPENLGADRLADVCGAVWRYGAPVLVVDIGTAATFNLVLEDTGFVGGAIAPGPALFTQYLAARTAQLPLVDLPAGKAPRVGRATAEAIRLSACVGYPAMVEAIAAHVAKSGPVRLPVVVTGGYARWVATRCAGRYVVDPLLTLRGIGRCYALNRRNGSNGGR